MEEEIMGISSFLWHYPFSLSCLRGALNMRGTTAGWVARGGPGSRGRWEPAFLLDGRHEVEANWSPTRPKPVCARMLPIGGDLPSSSSQMETP